MVGFVGLDQIKNNIISKLNFECTEDAKPFYMLPVKTLIHIQKTTEADVTKGYCSNRLYYISKRIKVSLIYHHVLNKISMSACVYK